MYHNDQIIITQPDLLRLGHLLAHYLPTWPYLRTLERRLADARVVPPDAVPPDVITMGTRFSFTDRRTGVAETYRLVYPDEADLERGRLSVFAPIGTAVLGRAVGRALWWKVPYGLRFITIDRVLFQPEADGPDDGARSDDQANDVPIVGDRRARA